MSPPDALRIRLLLWVTLSAGLTAVLEGLRLLAGAPFSWDSLAACWTFVAGLLFVLQWTQPYAVGKAIYVWPWPGGLVAGIGVGAALVYGVSGATWTAWGVLWALYVLLLGLERVLAGGQSAFRRWGVRGLLALAGGAIPVAIAQVESHFADEEFFVALEAVALSVFWLLLLGGSRFLVRRAGASGCPGVRVDRRIIGLAFCLVAFAALNGTVWAYRHSFYPPVAPTYLGVSARTPFLCGQVLPDPETYDGLDVFRRILARVEANPRKGAPEYGMLALATGEQRWAEAFRESLLREVAEGRFTGPAHSVKSVQFEAALRAYYYPRVRDRFPGLFADAEDKAIREWFAAINRRALTVEWVDLMYGLAFSKWPEGPYENQENGAGLLALLEAEGLADPKLSAANRDYLARNRRGWEARFRVTDDAIVYQPEWIYNAYFQSLYTGHISEENLRRSFEWLLLQALPDGVPLRYNHLLSSSLAGVAYLGARLTGEPRYLWLAGRAVEVLEQREGYLYAQPGVEEPVLMEGRSPTAGSCLIFGDSGLPNQVGPLAPDKIVFRDGWSEDAAYLLLNLRFTGWHRYKATNTVTLVYRQTPLAVDVLDNRSFSWLPVGRSLFRDKRIPRENLNGLLVPKTGMAAVLYTLTGIGGPWAQDPPYYAEVVAFETGEGMDWAHIRLTGWRGWQHDRWVYFYHGGPIVVVDEAKGPARGRAALAWHLSGGRRTEERRIRLRDGAAPAEMLLIPVGSEGRLKIAEEKTGDSGLSVVYYTPADGRLRVVTLFLLEQWVGTDVRLGVEERTLLVAQGQSRITLPLHWGE